MNLKSLIKKAILSEKAYKQMESGIYTFLVDPKSTKKEIAKVIEKQFSVKVEKVNVTQKASKKKRIAQTRKHTETGGGKKAIVYLAPGQSIPMLLPKAETKTKTKKSKTTEKVQEKGLLSKLRKPKETGKEDKEK